MPGVLGLLGTVALNYLRHRRGWGPTICQVTRRHIPRALFAAAFPAAATGLYLHVLRGYPRHRKGPA